MNSSFHGSSLGITRYNQTQEVSQVTAWNFGISFLHIIMSSLDKTLIFRSNVGTGSTVLHPKSVIQERLAIRFRDLQSGFNILWVDDEFFGGLALYLCSDMSDINPATSKSFKSFHFADKEGKDFRGANHNEAMRHLRRKKIRSESQTNHSWRGTFCCHVHHVFVLVPVDVQ